MTEKQMEGLEAGKILDELEVPTAAYEVWTKEENEKDKMEIFRELPELATVHNKLYRDQDVEEALRQAVQQARQRERRRTLNKVKEIRDELQHRVDVALEEKEEAEEDSWAEKRSIERINNYDLSQRKIQKLVEELEEEVNKK